MDALEVPIRVGAPLFSFVCCFVSVSVAPCAFILSSCCASDLLSFTFPSVLSPPSPLIPPPRCSAGAADWLPCLLAPNLLCAAPFFFSFCCLGRTADVLLSWRADGDRRTRGTRGRTKTLAEEMHTQVCKHTHTRARAHMLSDCMAFTRKNAVLGMSHCVHCVFSTLPLL